MLRIDVALGHANVLVCPALKVAQKVARERVACFDVEGEAGPWSREVYPEGPLGEVVGRGVLVLADLRVRERWVLLHHRLVVSPLEAEERLSMRTHDVLHRK